MQPLTTMIVAHPRRRGFSLVELLVSMAIIAILASILLPVLSTGLEKARHARSMGIRSSIQKDADCVLYFNFEEDPEPVGDFNNRAWYMNAEAFDKSFTQTALQAVPTGVTSAAAYGRFTGQRGVGFTAATGKLDVGRTQHFTALDITDRISAEAWVKVTAPFTGTANSGVLADIISKADTGQESFRFRLVNWGVGRDSISLWVELFDDNGNRTMAFNFPDPLEFPRDTWHHVAFTFDGTQIALYMNGAVVQTSNAFANKTIRDTGANSHVEIGKSLGSSLVKANVAEVALYARALAADEITAHYRGGVN